MRPLFTILMFLLSWIFGCSRSNDKKKPASMALPFLPDLPQAAHVPVDPGFVARNFIFTPDRNHILLLTYSADGDPLRMPYRLMKLDMQGKVQARLDLPNRRWVLKSAMWWSGADKLSLMLEESILTIDPADVRVVGEFRLIGMYNFLPRKKLDELIPAEQEEAYAATLAKVRAAHPDAKVQFPPKGREAFVIIGKSAWIVPDEGKADPAQLGVGEQIGDGQAALKRETSDVVGTILRYPRFVAVTVDSYRLQTPQHSLAFQTTDKGDRDLEIYVSDDRKLASADGAVWLRYERLFYRVGP